MIISVIFVLLFLAFLMGIILVPKIDGKINMIKVAVMGIMAIFCYQSFWAFMFQLVGIPVNLKSTCISMAAAVLLLWGMIIKKKKMQAMGQAPVGGCPGSRMRQLERKPAEENQNAGSPVISQLRQWPVQIKLAPVNAPYFDGAKLLIAADCTAYAYGSFHQDFIRGKVTLIGCPKLDDVDYSEKLTEIIRNNDIKSVTVVRMEVPCCGGLEHAAVTALKNSGKFIPWNVVTISIDGKILD
jgi:hypothetical protein